MEHVCFHYYSKISQGSLFILQNLAYMDICKDIYIGKMTSLRDIWENPIFSVDFDSSLSPSVEFCKNFVIYILKGALQRGGGGFLRKIRIFLLERFQVARVPKKALKWGKNGVFGKKRVLIETFGRNPSRSVVENANAHKTTNF